MKLLSNFDKWVLMKFSYDIKNQAGNKNKWSYISDLTFLLIYSAISLYNALIMMFQNLALTSSSAASPSGITIFLNIIILVRLNISIYIKKKESIYITEKELLKHGIVKKIDIKAWQRRLGIIYIGYVIVIVIAMFYLFYGSVVSKSLGFIGIIAIIETFINSFLDNLTARYEAVPEVYIKR